MSLLRVAAAAALLVLASLSPVTASPPKPIGGQAYPRPTNLLSENGPVLAAWQNFTSAMDALAGVGASNGSGLLANYTISVGAFSVHDPAASKTLQYHHTGPDVANSTTGVTRVDGDSVYRLGSVSKLFTVYLLLVTVGSQHWETPVTDFIPELLAPANASTKYGYGHVDWSKITVGALAGQVAGIPRDVPPSSTELLQILQNPVALGFPPVDVNELIPLVPKCTLVGLNCSREDYIASLKSRGPVVAPWTDPVYANTGYIVLGLVISAATGKDLTAAFDEYLLRRLGMNSTFYSTPRGSLDDVVVPGGNATDSILLDVGLTGASGGVLSSTNDLARLGVSILNSTLLRSEDTNRWLKPVTHTGVFEYSVGRPWEIARFTQPGTGLVHDLYAKAGDSIDFSATVILSVDHGVGFSVLVARAGETPSPQRAFVADELMSTFMPALDAHAAVEAAAKFAGTYASADPALNSSVSFAAAGVSSPKAGLFVTSWVSNGTDMLATALLLNAKAEMTLFPAATGFGSANLRRQEVEFRATFGDSSQTAPLGLFQTQESYDSNWLTMDQLQYLGRALDHFVFEVDESGRATAVTPVVLGAKLAKQPGA